MTRIYGLLLASLTLLAIAVACSGETGDTPLRGDTQLSVLSMARDVSIATNRVPLTVFSSGMTRVDDRLADMTFSYRHVDDEDFIELTGITWRAWPVSGGAYVTEPVFDRVGFWEFRVTLLEAGSRLAGTTFVDARQHTGAPEVGEPAPLVKTRTAATVEEAQEISSALMPDPAFYSLSLDDAVSNGRPTVVLFSTPAFCVTQTCGPQLETLGRIKTRHGEKIDFIHVEIWGNVREMLDTGDRSIGRLSLAVEEWGLITEPWTFFVSSSGVVVQKFEQYTTAEELEEAISRLLDG